MKKYFIASVVAVLAFAFAAFAASLNVSAATIQAGEDTDVDCVGAANVAAWGYDDTDAMKVAYVTIDTISESCVNDEVMHVVLLDDDGHQLARGDSDDGLAQPFYTLDGSGNHQYKFNFDPWVDVADIEGIRIGVDQGHTDYVYP